MRNNSEEHEEHEEYILEDVFEEDEEQYEEDEEHTLPLYPVEPSTVEHGNISPRGYLYNHFPQQNL